MEKTIGLLEANQKPKVVSANTSSGTSVPEEVFDVIPSLVVGKVQQPKKEFQMEVKYIYLLKH